MPDSPGPNLRLLAPVAVAVFAVAMLIVLVSSGALSGGGANQSAGTSESAEERRAEGERRRSRRERSGGSTAYTIKAGDTLGSIAEENEVSVEQIQELNPQLDPQALTAGQRIKLRE